MFKFLRKRASEKSTILSSILGIGYCVITNLEIPIPGAIEGIITALVATGILTPEKKRIHERKERF